MLVRFLRNFAGKKNWDPPKVAYSFFGLFSIFFNGFPTSDPPLCCSWSEKNSHAKIKLLAFMWWKLMRKNLKNVCGNPQKQNKHTHPQGGCVKFFRKIFPGKVMFYKVVPRQFLGINMSVWKFLTVAKKIYIHVYAIFDGFYR